ncbi:MAG: 4Fe-4S binding protein, partial [candidate division WOR-3 bacterium]
KTGEPWFCKLCPQGTLGAGIPLVLWDPLGGLRDMVGWLYWVKISILLLVLLAAISIKRPFCRLICPIGAIYSLFNKISLLHLTVGEGCSTCRVCAKVCPMDIEVHRDPNQGECIRCLECRSNCRPRSVSVKF